MEQTLQSQYNLIKEGKGNKAVFLKSAYRLFPDMLSPVNTFEDTVKILKNRSILSEGIGGVVTTGKTPDSLEGKIVQDADRLDALGAIGIARTFSYGGKNNRLIYDPTTNDGTDSRSHFYQKLLVLKNLMNTDKAKKEAEVRTEYMIAFLETLEMEIT